MINHLFRILKPFLLTGPFPASKVTHVMGIRGLIKVPHMDKGPSPYPRIVSDGKIQISILILRRRPCLPLTLESVLVFSDIKSMYDNVDCDEAVAEVKS